jgi:transposase
MRDFAWMLGRHLDVLLNYLRQPIDEGMVDGLNNEAKVISHKSYGFRTAKCDIQNRYYLSLLQNPSPHITTDSPTGRA